MSYAYFSRELCLLEFNRRVMYQAYDKSLPLMERLRYLCIFSTNLDEFFEVRVGGLVERIDLAAKNPFAPKAPLGPDGFSDQQTLSMIAEVSHQLVEEQYAILNQDLLPEMRKAGLTILRRDDWTAPQVAWLKAFFASDVLPVLSPIGLDPAHPFPRILNKSLNFIVRLDGKDAFGRSSGRAIVQVPRSLSHLIELPAELCKDQRCFVFLSSIIHYFMAELFNGMTVIESYQFRLTRNSDIFLDEEEAEDLLRAVQGELVHRQYGDEVRLEITDTCTPELTQFLLSRCEIKERDLYKINGPVNLDRLRDLFELVKNPEMYFPTFTQAMPKLPKRSSSYFDLIQKQDILLHHPFDSFQCVVDFLREAANDPQVLAIKQTLYRTGSDSPIVDALVSAAKAGKEVTAIVELRARFDEEQNVALAERLQRFGIHVIYGVVGFKTHAKMILVARREDGKLRNYIHLSTGNYHLRTTKLYTDYALLTCDKEIGDDVYRVFLQLSSMGKASKMDCLFYAPFTLHKSMIKLIRAEKENALHGKAARIILKMNALFDKELVDELYAAAGAGVQIDLLIRGVCQLQPGVPGVSDKIHVRSIVGRFLEHSRVFYFENAGDPLVYCASADWMTRNMFHRVEICFPIKAKKIRDSLIQDLHLYLKDNSHAWLLQSDGQYRRLSPLANEELVSAQSEILKLYSK